MLDALVVVAVPDTGSVKFYRTDANEHAEPTEVRQFQ